MKASKCFVVLAMICVLYLQYASAGETADKQIPRDRIARIRGLGWGFKNIRYFKLLNQTGWWYNWGSKGREKAMNYSQKMDIDYVPMAWGQWHLDTLADDILPGAKVLLGFNEPNHIEQANLYPAHAAQLWKQYVEPVADMYDLRLGSPSPAGCGGNCITQSPFVWWDEFFANCTDCRVDFIATHYYSCSANALKWFLDEIYTRYKRPIWLTEFSCPNGNRPLANQIFFMYQALKVLDSHPAVEKYAWFAITTKGGWLGTTPSLLQNSSTHPWGLELTALGRIYLNYRSAGSGSRLPMQLEDDASGITLEGIERAGTVKGDWMSYCAPCFSDGASLVSGSQLMERCSDCSVYSDGTVDNAREQTGLYHGEDLDL